MAHHSQVRWPLAAALLVVFAVWPMVPAQAKTLHVYDRDSLVHLSSEVIEAEIVRSYTADKLALIDVRVTMVHKGEFKNSQNVVVVANNIYRKPKKDEPHNNMSLEVGDRLVLFLARAKGNSWYPIPDDAVICAPLPGGMRLVQGDHVYPFAQRDNPGPYVAEVPSDPARSKPLTLERFRGQVRDSLRDTEQLARLIEAKQDQLDVPRLLKLLTDRSELSMWDRDYFTERTCIRLAESHDPELLGRALPLVKGHYGVSILQHGFGTPRGRDYLLARVAEATEPMLVRLRHARALSKAGEVYRSTLTEITANSYKPVGEADKGNSEYLTRIARVARDQGREVELCNVLVRCLDLFGHGIVQSNRAPLVQDLHGALAVLKELYDTKPAEELQFAIESATVNADRTAYEKLKSPCGTFISMLSPGPSYYAQPKERSLIFTYDYHTGLLNHELSPSLVLVHQGTQKRHVLPSQLRIRGGATGGGSTSVVLPTDLPAGRYHVFFEVSEGAKVISTGHFFAADL